MSYQLLAAFLLCDLGVACGHCAGYVFVLLSSNPDKPEPKGQS
jgi:hypothetical protein